MIGSPSGTTFATGPAGSHDTARCCQAVESVCAHSALFYVRQARTVLKVLPAVTELSRASLPQLILEERAALKTLVDFADLEREGVLKGMRPLNLEFAAMV